MVASKLQGPEEILIKVPGSEIAALPSAIIYGANASGKTNLVEAFRFMRNVILNSHSQGDPEGGVPRIPFKLSSAKENEPTAVEADFTVDGVRFQYGFECNDDVFSSEWLFSYPEGKRRKIFERKGLKVDFGAHFKGPKKILVDLMRGNSLFMSTATQNDHEELSKLVAFFRRAAISSNIFVAREILDNRFKKDQIDARTIKFLTAIGTGVIGHRQTSLEVPEKVLTFGSELDAFLKKYVTEGIGYDSPFDKGKYLTIELAHASEGGDMRYFKLDQESSGTRRLILLMSMVFKALDDGSLLFIDELDASLHTHAAEQVLSLFSRPEINRKGAQLIATTHDTNLLSSACLRRDQIWFCEKNSSGATHLFPLSDIKSRHTDDFEKGYLQGRYGAIPFSGDLVSLFRG